MVRVDLAGTYALRRHEMDDGLHRLADRRLLAILCCGHRWQARERPDSSNSPYSWSDEG